MVQGKAQEETEETIQINELTRELYHSFVGTDGWKEQRIGNGQALQLHQHGFDAIYFTNGVRGVYTGENERILPQYAAVRIAAGNNHAWNGVKNGNDAGVIGHFHQGHGLHTIVSEYKI